MAAKKRSAKKKSKRTAKRASKATHGSKSEFVREHPDTPATELVALAKKQGITITPGHVYNIRANDKKKGPKGKKGKPSASAPAFNGPKADQLRALVLQMGLDQAETVFGELRAEMSKLGVR